MMAAEKWYEYQDSYKRYSFDMQPRTERKPAQRSKSNSAVSAKDRLRLLILILFVGVTGIGLIVANAYASSVQHHINTIIKDSRVVQGEIENLNVKIESASNIQIIEQRALNEIGMVYPGPDDLVYINNTETEKAQDFAMLIKEGAYYSSN